MTVRQPADGTGAFTNELTQLITAQGNAYTEAFEMCLLYGNDKPALMATKQTIEEIQEPMKPQTPPSPPWWVGKSWDQVKKRLESGGGE